MADCVCPLANLGNILHFSIMFDIEGYVVNLVLLNIGPGKYGVPYITYNSNCIRFLHHRH